MWDVTQCHWMDGFSVSKEIIAFLFKIKGVHLNLQLIDRCRINIFVYSHIYINFHSCTRYLLH